MEQYNLYVVARALERILQSALPYFIVASVSTVIIMLVYFLAYKKWSAKMVKKEELHMLEKRVQLLEQKDLKK